MIFMLVIKWWWSSYAMIVLYDQPAYPCFCACKLVFDYRAFQAPCCSTTSTELSVVHLQAPVRSLAIGFQVLKSCVFMNTTAIGKCGKCWRTVVWQSKFSNDALYPTKVYSILDNNHSIAYIILGRDVVKLIFN